MNTKDEDDGFGPYLCVSTKRPCNPARDHCRCWWLSENPEHWQRLAKIKIDGVVGKETSDAVIGEKRGET